MGDKVKKTEMARYVAYLGDRRGAYRALVGKPEGRTPPGRPRRRWEDNIKVDLQEFGWGGGAWIGSIWLKDRDVLGCCECGDEPWGSIKCRKFLE
jgi:hypothetical protein